MGVIYRALTIATWHIRLRGWRPGAYARDSARLLAWLCLRAVAQSALVLLLARWLGAESYGAFVAALAVASFFTPLAGLGLHAVLLREGARQPQELPHLLRRALRLWLIAGTLATLAVVMAITWSLPPSASLDALIALAVAEVMGASLIEMLARLEQAQHRAARFGAILAGLPLIRLIALFALLGTAPSLAAWLLAYATATFIYAMALTKMAWLGFRTDNAPRSAEVGRIATPALIRAGAPFALGALALRLQAEFNKPVLAQLGYAPAATLGVAQRVVDLAALPLAALQEALWPRVLAAANPGRRLLTSGALLMALALVAGLAVALAAPLLPWLLGPEYAGTADVLAWLAGLPALQVMRNLGNVWLMGKGRSGMLYLVHVTAAITGILLVITLVPRHGLLGAVWSLYGTEVLAMLIIFIGCRLRRSSPSEKRDE